MREDMKRVIITPPRHQGYGSSKGREANRDMEDLPTKESMRKKHVMNWGGKEFSDFLTPLRRFLEKNAGRPWDKVYSEICEHADSRSLTGWHLRQHVSFEVKENVMIDDDGRVYDMHYSYRPYELWNDALYVCPKSGLLKKYKRGSKRNDYKRKKKFSCLEEEIAHFTEDFQIPGNGLSKYTTLEWKDGELWILFWKEGKEDVVSWQKATERHASYFIQPWTFRQRGWGKHHNMNAVIKNNLKPALCSSNPCVKEMARMVKSEMDKETKQANQKEQRIDDVLRAEKQRRKAEKRAKKLERMAS